jgi:hypothetical protein
MQLYYLTSLLTSRPVGFFYAQVLDSWTFYGDCKYFLFMLCLPGYKLAPCCLVPRRIACSTQLNQNIQLKHQSDERIKKMIGVQDLVERPKKA